MAELKVEVNPKVKLLIETLTSEDKLKIMENKLKKQKLEEKKKEEEKKEKEKK